MELPVELVDLFELVDLSVDTEIECSVEKKMALELFDIAQRKYTEEQLSVLVTLFANPLCRLLFQARKRSFSDYAVTVAEPLDQDIACSLIDNILALKNDESKIELFFDEMQALKPLPLSQKHTIEYIHGSVEIFMEGVVSSHVIPYLQMNPTAPRDQVYKDVKYQIAIQVEREDYCCQRSYVELMQDIRTYLEIIMPKSSLRKTSFFPSESKIEDTPDTDMPNKKSRNY